MDIIEDDYQIVVSDFKTGKYLKQWKQEKENNKIKAWKYETQLTFYKLLVENSSQYGGKYKVKQGNLEFIECNPESNEVVILEKQISYDEAQQLAKLIQIVYKKIINLDFPNTSYYPATNKGIKMFIDDLLEGKI
jgi:uncharacterized protein (DUF1330 family)